MLYRTTIFLLAWLFCTLPLWLFFKVPIKKAMNWAAGGLLVVYSVYQFVTLLQ